MVADVTHCQKQNQAVPIAWAKKERSGWVFWLQVASEGQVCSAVRRRECSCQCWRIVEII